jgi:iron complex transport system substrate-binding protein
LGERFVGRQSGQPERLGSRPWARASQPAAESGTAGPPNIGLLRSPRRCRLLFYKHSAPTEPCRARSALAGALTKRVGTCKALALLLLAGFFLIPAACGRRPAARPGLVVTDEIGRRVSVPAQPQRLISLAPSVTEILFALGLGSRVVGVTSYCDYPPEAKSVEKVGDTQRPSLEKIVGLKPDLVIVSTASQLEEFVRKLEEVGIAIYVSNPRDLEGLLSSIERIGEITAVPERAAELVKSLRARIEAVHASIAGAQPEKVLFIIGTQPLITAGGNTFIDDLIRRAGGLSISTGETAEYPQFSLETALARKPEVIFMQSGRDELPAQLKDTPAARNGRVFHIDDALLLRPGPRIVDGLELMAARLHPELFSPRNTAVPGS